MQSMKDNLECTKVILKIAEIFSTLLSDGKITDDLVLPYPWKFSKFSIFYKLEYKEHAVLEFNPKADFIENSTLFGKSGCYTSDFKKITTHIRPSPEENEFHSFLYPEFKLTEELLFQYSLLFEDVQDLEFYKELVETFKNVNLKKDILIFWFMEYISKDLLDEFLLNMTAIKEKLYA
ncbi:hypothetical protein [Escherichia phage vB_EcoM_JNE01]|nr:hypothetical protein [Escherichia phage vB_EcoM_JNE01]